MSCKTSNVLPPDYKGNQMHFGQGGGFTGAVTYFALLDDGRLFKKETSDTTFTYISTWKKDFTTQMFSNYSALGLDRIDHYHPGNLYYFIELHSPGQRPHLISWGQEGYSPSDNVITFYHLLYKSTRSKS